MYNCKHWSLFIIVIKWCTGEQLQTIDNAGETSKVTGEVQGHKATKNKKRSQHKDKVMATTL